jgi:hypothetical protein
MKSFVNSQLNILTLFNTITNSTTAITNNDTSTETHLFTTFGNTSNTGQINNFLVKFRFFTLWSSATLASTAAAL